MNAHALRAGILVMMVLVVGDVSAADLQEPGQLAQVIDQEIERLLPEVTATPLINESAFIRRVTLDLAGRIPTRDELHRFRQSESLQKRSELVERLIHSADFAFHQRNELDTLLLRRLVKDQNWRDYLLEATQENRPWDQLFREIITPEYTRPDDLRPVAFLKQRVRDLDKMANDASVIWFGVNIGCAKCHDHPLVDDWKQSHYYGLASFFKRTYQTRKGALGERFDGSLQYETTEGETHNAEFMFLTGTKVTEPESPLDSETLKQYEELIKKAEREDEAESPPQPEFQPRSRLVELALSDSEQPFFARNIVNRIWARMFGRGLIHPLDQMHSGNPPSHPDLLEQLTQDLIQHDYDLRRLIHAIALTDTYARSMIASRSESQEVTESPPIDSFGAAIPRPLSPHQLSLSLIIATRNPDSIRDKMAGSDWAAERESLERQSEAVAQQLEIPGESFQVPVSEALWFSNNQQVQNEYLRDGSDRLVGHLLSIEANDVLIRTATETILSRDPHPEELTSLSGYLEQRVDRRRDAVEHLVWALLSSPEFRFNH